MPTLDTTTLYLSRGRGSLAKRAPFDSFSLREKVAEGRMRVKS